MPLTVMVAHVWRVHGAATAKPSGKVACRALETALHHEPTVIAHPKTCPLQPPLHNGPCTARTRHDERAREIVSGVCSTHEHRQRAGGDRGASPPIVDDLRRHDRLRSEREVDPHQVPTGDHQRVFAVAGDAPSKGISNRFARASVGGASAIGFPAVVIASMAIVCRDGSWGIHKQRRGQKWAVWARTRRTDDHKLERDRGEAERVTLRSTCALGSAVDTKP